MINYSESMHLDGEEQWFEESADSFVSAGPELREKLIQAAKDTKAKTERMNIRMSKTDMDRLKMLAVREGMPYQTLVTSVLHKYTAGLLVDINEAKKILAP